MRYFIDTEFIEGFHKPFLGKRRHFIDLISIGIVAEDGREYYAISKDFDEKKASEWVKENVISKLEPEFITDYDYVNFSNENEFFPSIVDNPLWKTNKQIKQDILEFFGFKFEWTDWGSDMLTTDNNIQVYGYYADYDWVLFCSLFGTMMELPKGMPHYCRDLKQMMDERQLTTIWKNKNYPDPVGEHNALIDARWNKQLYEKIQDHAPLIVPLHLVEQVSELWKKINEQRHFIATAASSEDRDVMSRKIMIDNATAVKNRLHMELGALLDQKF